MIWRVHVKVPVVHFQDWARARRRSQESLIRIVDDTLASIVVLQLCGVGRIVREGRRIRNHASWAMADDFVKHVARDFVEGSFALAVALQFCSETQREGTEEGIDAGQIKRT
jgi:hypothetical protein